LALYTCHGLTKAKQIEELLLYTPTLCHLVFVEWSQSFEKIVLRIVCDGNLFWIHVSTRIEIQIDCK